MKSKREIKKIAQKCISIEVNEAKNLKKKIDDNFVDVVNVLHQTKGRIIIPTRSLTKKDLENFPIEVNIIIIY